MAGAVAAVAAKALVLTPLLVLGVCASDVGGARQPSQEAVLTVAEAVARPVADGILERLHLPSAAVPAAPACPFGPHSVGDPCSRRT